ncbi:hypothetical protein Lser_V15G13432 [Lactuca serriola]
MYGIPVPRYALVNRDKPYQDLEYFVEEEDFVEVHGQRFWKPFVEKPVYGDDHSIMIYYPSAAGGGMNELFRKLCWDPKHADLIATASGDKNVCLWDVCSGKCSQQAELSGENINITYKPDGTHVAVGNQDDELTILDVRKFKPIHKRKFNYKVNEIACNMSGDMLFLTTLPSGAGNPSLAL